MKFIIQILVEIQQTYMILQKITTTNIGHKDLQNQNLVEQDKAKKILVFKYKRRKRYRRKQGHRQQYTAVKIDKIEIKNGSETGARLRQVQ